MFHAFIFHVVAQPHHGRWRPKRLLLLFSIARAQLMYSENKKSIWRYIFIAFNHSLTTIHKIIHFFPRSHSLALCYYLLTYYFLKQKSNAVDAFCSLFRIWNALFVYTLGMLRHANQKGDGNQRKDWQMRTCVQMDLTKITAGNYHDRTEVEFSRFQNSRRGHAVQRTITWGITVHAWSQLYISFTSQLERDCIYRLDFSCTN